MHLCVCLGCNWTPLPGAPRHSVLWGLLPFSKGTNTLGFAPAVRAFAKLDFIVAFVVFIMFMLIYFLLLFTCLIILGKLN